jgi:hypothetical protein
VPAQSIVCVLFGGCIAERVLPAGRLRVIDESGESLTRDVDGTDVVGEGSERIELRNRSVEAFVFEVRLLPGQVGGARRIRDGGARIVRDSDERAANSLRAGARI